MDTIVTSSLSGPKEGMMMRIHPSMRALEFALSYGCNIQNNTRVTSIDESLEFQGIKYDYIVLATEASSIKHILSQLFFHRFLVVFNIKAQSCSTRMKV